MKLHENLKAVISCACLALAFPMVGCDGGGTTPDGGDGGGEAGPLPVGTKSTIIPDSSWTCGMSGGIPDPTSGKLVFATTLTPTTTLDLGQTQFGARKVFPIDSGTLAGGTLNGSVQDGSIEFVLTLPSGAVELESRLVLKASDGTLIYMRSCGVADGAAERLVVDFEAPNSSGHSSLNSGTYIGVREAVAGGIRLAVYSTSATPDSSKPVVQTPADPGLPQQSWTCSGGSGKQKGTEVFTATVNIGTSLSVGASKYGSRTIIPITGGSFSGSSISGTVNAGGADFQLQGSDGYGIEARYTIKDSKGNLILVRNCGVDPLSNVTKITLETSKTGSAAWLNNKTYVGTLGVGLGSVTIGVYNP